MFRLAKAPRIEHIKNTFLGEKRSEIAKKAKHNVPAINPNWTDEVTQPIEAGSRFQCTCRSEIIAFPANHKEVPANWEITRTGKIQTGLLVTLNVIELIETYKQFTKDESYPKRFITFTD